MAGGTWWEAFNEPTSLNTVLSIALGIWGQVSVAIFVAISAYFLCDSKKVNYSSILKLYVQTVVLNFIVRLIGLYISQTFFAKTIVKESVHAVLSPIRGEYWFLTAFLAFMLMVPILRVFIENVSRNVLRNISAVLLVIMNIGDFVNLRFAGALFDFTVLFLVVSYLKKYHDKGNHIKARLIVMISCAVLLVAIIGINTIGTITGVEKIYKLSTHIFVNWNIVIVAAATSILWTFKDFNIKHSKLINWFAKCSFGVYLLSENSVMLKNSFWNKLLYNNTYLPGDMIALKLVVSAVSVYFICVAIESLRLILFENTFYKNGYVKKAMGKFNNLLNW